MWPNNSFGNNGNFQNNFNQDDFQTSPFGINSGPPLPGQQYFPQHQSPQNPMQYENAYGDGYISNELQPEISTFNHGAFTQNQFPNPNNTQFSPSPFNGTYATAPMPARPTQINARAAELKAQLLKGREVRPNSATPPVATTGQDTQPSRTDGSALIRGSPRASARGAETKLDIDNLISQYSDLIPAAPTSEKQEKNNGEANDAAKSQRPSISASPAKSQATSLGSPTKIVRPSNNIKPAVKKTSVKVAASPRTNNSSVSEISEGEILEEPIHKNAIQPILSATPAAPAATRDHSSPRNVDEASRKQHTDQTAKQGCETHEKPQQRALANNPKAQPLRSRDDRREEAESRSDKKQYQTEHKYERKSYPEAEKRHPPQREDHSHPEEGRHESKNEQKREDNRVAPKPPTLAELLPLDRNLREWLDITGYHNAPYRDKILNRRRAIAALDAEKQKLLAEIEIEERGGLQIPTDGQATTSMLPPPIPLKTEIITPEVQKDRVSSKRPYSEIQDSKDDASLEKAARIDDHFHAHKIRVEEDSEHHRPKSSGYDSSRRFSDGGYDYRREDREPLRHNEGHGRDRHSSHERDMSPALRANENGPTQPRARDEEPYDRAWGNYRGRAFDPNYRGRSRGRGRSDWYSSADRTSGYRTYGTSITTIKPFRDVKGFDKGAKGDTRYFIVKSFNEDNVLKCIEDSIWITQIQNGELFKEAFETCKNVILVFSINKSKAFQGYARMESLPGSVQVPLWQRSINWESTGAFKVKWLVICSTRFHRIGHLKNSLNENQAVLIGKDGQEIEEKCGTSLIELINEEADQAISDRWRYKDDRDSWED